MRMPGMSWRHLGLWLALVMLAGVGWVRHAVASPGVLAGEPPASLCDHGDRDHEPTPALPPDPSSDGDPSETESDADSKERLALLAEGASIPPAGLLARIRFSLERLQPRYATTSLYRPPRR
jgi:hypothetical protein